MEFNSPQLGPAESLAVIHVERLRTELLASLRMGRRWLGLFRRLAVARHIQASRRLDGSAVGLDDVLAAIDGDEPFDASLDTWADLRAHRDTLSYLAQVAHGDGERSELSATMVRSMHFILTRDHPDADPGRWRDADAQTAMAELVARLAVERSHPVVRGALSHMWLTQIQPFKAANGGAARLTHSLISLDGTGYPTDPVWVGIDEYLATNVDLYRAVLSEVATDSGARAGDPTPWIRFCLTAHYRQAASLLSRVQEAERLWSTCTLLAVDNAVPVRAVGALTEAAQGQRLRNATYRTTVALTEHDEISEQTASRDLKSLVDAGLLRPVGEKRARLYRGGSLLRAAWAQVRAQQPPPDTSEPPLDPGLAD